MNAVLRYCLFFRRLFPLTITTMTVVLLVTELFASRAESVIPIIDASPAGSPIAIVGTVLATDADSGLLRYSFRTDASLTNVSRKPILATVIKINTTGANKMDQFNTRKDDYFFAESFQPNTTERLEQSDGPFGESQGEVDAPPAQPRVVASVTFAQFADGTIWGDPAAGRDILQERRLTLDQLSSLATAYRTGGEPQFQEELKKPSQLNLILYLQQLYDSNRNDLARVIKKLTRMIDYADHHQREMQSRETTN
jgi:hypothetical protein